MYLYLYLYVYVEEDVQCVYFAGSAVGRVRRCLTGSMRAVSMRCRKMIWDTFREFPVTGRGTTDSRS